MNKKGSTFSYSSQMCREAHCCVGCCRSKGIEKVKFAYACEWRIHLRLLNMIGMQTAARKTLHFQLLEDEVVHQGFSMYLRFYMCCLLLLVLGTGYCIKQTFGLTCYGNTFVFMSSEIYFFNHSCCEQLYEVKLLIGPRKCGVYLRNEFSMERVHSEVLSFYGDNKHTHKGDRIISCCTCWVLVSQGLKVFS